jgi:AcrR family transcriptional regulator
VAAATPVRRPYAARRTPEQRREQLLDAALGIALERGFHAVTVDGVARAAGVTRPVVYGQFADRAALLTALLDRSEQRALAQLAPALPAVPAPGEAVDPEELLVDGMTAYLSAVHADPRTWRVVLLPPEGAPAELSERIEAAHRGVLRTLRELVTWGMSQRRGPELDVDLVARSVLTLAEGAARLLLEDAERYPVERFVTFTRTALTGLLRD